jgi:hypothetical protein
VTTLAKSLPGFTLRHDRQSELVRLTATDSLLMRTIYKLLLHISWLLTLGVLCEIVCRVLLTSPSAQITDPVVSFSYIPDSRIFYGAEGGATIRINSLGLNSPYLNPHSQLDRCLLLGDSFTEALHVKREDNFATLADDLLPETEIVNAGRSDAGPADCLEIFRRLDLKIKPDRIVFVMNESDLTDLDRDNSLILNTGRIDISPRPQSRAKALLGPLLNHSALATHLARKANSVFSRTTGNKNSNHRNTKQDETSSIHNHRLLLLRGILAELSERHRVDVIFIPQLDYQPLRHAAPTPVSRECWSLIVEARVNIPVEIHSMETLFIRAYKETGQPPHGFANRKIGIGHLNHLGHRITSQKLVEILRK